MNYIELPLASIIIIHRLNLMAKAETVDVSDSYCDKISYENLLLSIHQLIEFHPPQLRVPSRWKTSEVRHVIFDPQDILHANFVFSKNLSPAAARNSLR